MKKVWFLLFIFISYIIYGILIANDEMLIFPQEIKREHPSGFFDYRGVINVHSNLSTGSGTPLEIVEEANLAGLDFLVLTDLNLFQKTEGVEGYHQNLLTLVGGEYGYLDSRLLYISPKSNLPAEALGDLQVRFADHLSQQAKDVKDALLILAHPLREGYQWTGEYPSGLNGIEVFNLNSLLANTWQKSKLSFFWTFFVLPFNQRLAFMRLYSEPKAEISLWDELNKKNMVYGYFGNDSTAKAIPFSGYNLKFPSYERSFSLGSNHVLLKSELTGNVQSDKQKIFEAFKKGNFYMCMDIVGDPKGFNAVIEDKDKTYLMGSTVKIHKELTLKVHLPAKPLFTYEVVLMKDGERYEGEQDQDVDFKITEPGVYRVQVRIIPTYPLPDGKKWISWIHTNPFFVRN